MSIIDTTLCAKGLMKVEKIDVNFKDLKVGESMRKNGKFEKMSVYWTMAAQLVIEEYGTKKVNIVAEMITKNQMVRPLRFTARYHFALDIGYEGFGTQSSTRSDIVADKTIMTGKIILPESSNEVIPQINCSLTINLMRMVVDVEKIYSEIADILRRVKIINAKNSNSTSSFPEYYDIRVKGTKFRVNKKSFAAASKRSTKIFDESQNREYRDDETDPKAFEIILQFIIGTGDPVDFDTICAKENTDGFFALIKAALTYDIPTLREICIGYMLLNFANNLTDACDGWKLGMVWQLFEFRDYCREVILFDHLKFFEPIFPVGFILKEGEKCLTLELIKAEEIPKEKTMEKIRAYVDVAELYRKKLQEGNIEPELIEFTIKDFLKRKVAEM